MENHPPVRVERRPVTEEESRRANGPDWDRYADEYQSTHGEFLGDAGFVWGPEGLTEEVAGVLGDVTGKANKRFGRDRTDPTTCDTDRGGVRDGAEVRARSNPADWRSGPRDPRVRQGRTPADPFGIG